jgi:hypothetical protein
LRNYLDLFEYIEVLGVIWMVLRNQYFSLNIFSF